MIKLCDNPSCTTGLGNRYPLPDFKVYSNGISKSVYVCLPCLRAYETSVTFEQDLWLISQWGRKSFVDNTIMKITDLIMLTIFTYLSKTFDVVFQGSLRASNNSHMAIYDNNDFIAYIRMIDTTLRVYKQPLTHLKGTVRLEDPQFFEKLDNLLKMPSDNYRDKVEMTSKL